ncbi:tetrahydromethanopterin S-methyltransferase subunit F [Methanomicrobium antiquum]|uniref:Tetrahydromethanopterin S-methyltransferase subunit F n=1 Tax=Methanomicrobium antiquum TaxID=487686 RepID=A0AAF0FSE9_9EURY|nr:tetrahydromethanopterin S-methyltransferase subunit F [Methanomicrobium antiquum]MDD3977348.1 tetrahydromethanopterin S-methyltransferase subunit F [Methanomicrobium sp.]WFN37071.1 tetrahydromethanopterin S-methyltransferase subunit F [Methanomicrobium antiquum]
MSDEEKSGPTIIRMAAIEDMVDDIRFKSQILARTNKLESGIMSAGLTGFGIGVAISLVLVLLPVFLIGGI